MPLSRCARFNTHDLVVPARTSALHRPYTTQSTPTLFSASSSSKRHQGKAQTPASDTPWTKDDDKILAALRKKRFGLAQIQIYMSHQPVAAIEARMKDLDTKIAEKPTFQRWTPQEDALLEKAVQDLGLGNWSEISDVYFSHSAPDTATSSTSASSSSLSASTRRSPRSCQIRYKFLHPDDVSSARFKTGPWSADELELFQELVNPSASAECPNDWHEISKALGTRSAIQCHSQLKTVMHSGTKGKWTEEEVNRLLEARELFGGDWQQVAKHVGTRAPGQVRQKWNQFSEDVLRRLQARRLRKDM
ncbi:DNA binding transcription coactivator transcription factor [Mortierella alpina]|nr:DNA binding transcription coactivator transcription factor [Mortierella alpina]